MSKSIDSVETTILVPVYEKITQRDILNYFRDHSVLTLKNKGANGRHVSREILHESYRPYSTDKSGKGSWGYGYPSSEYLQMLTGRGDSYVKDGIKDMKTSGEWIVISGFGGRSLAGPGFSSRTFSRNNRYYPILPWAALPEKTIVHWKRETINRKKNETVSVIPDWATPEGYAAFLLERDGVAPESFVVIGEDASGEERLESDLYEVTPTAVAESPVVVPEAPVAAPEPVDSRTDEEPAVQAAEAAPQPVKTSVVPPVVTATREDLDLPAALLDALTPAERVEITSTPSYDLALLQARLRQIAGTGADIAETVRVARSNQKGARTMHIGTWLHRFALKFPKTVQNHGSNAGMISTNDFVQSQMHTKAEDVDYGQSGQEL